MGHQRSSGLVAGDIGYSKTKRKQIRRHLTQRRINAFAIFATQLKTVP
jgi:hypothetical protein